MTVSWSMCCERTMICVGTERRFLYYVSIGFKSCKKYNICTEDGRYPAAMMVKELIPHTLDDGKRFFYHGSPVMEFSVEEALRYDDTLEKMEKKYCPSQEEFYIMSHSFLDL